MKFSEYIQEVQQDKQLIELSSRRLHRIITKDPQEIKRYPFKEYPVFRQGEHGIYGLGEVLDDLVKAVETATYLNQQNQNPIILLTGPTGSGKTEIGKQIESVLIDDLQKNPRYSLKFRKNDDEEEFVCPYNEDPINLLTARLSLCPSAFRNEFYEEGRPQLCPQCLPKYNAILRKDLEHRKFDDLETYAKFLDDFIEAQLLVPQIACANPTSKKFREHIAEIMGHCNRGVLHFEVNDSSHEEIPPQNYQTLLQLADGKFVFNNGTSIIPDVVMLLYANWDVDEINPGDEKKAFKDRVIPVYVRRNLSWTQECRIYKRIEYSFDHINVIALEGIAKTVVGSRIDDISDEENIKKDLRRYDMVENFDISITDENLEEILKRLRKEEGRSLDGWNDGMSVREAAKEIGKIDLETGNCLTPTAALKWIEEKFGDMHKLLKDHVCGEIESRCVSDTVLSYVAVINGGMGKVEKLFRDYYQTYLRLLEGKKYTKYKGATKSPKEVLRLIEEKLGVDQDKSGQFRDNIEEFMAQQIPPKQNPTFRDIIDLDHEVIVSGDEARSYVPWNKLWKHEPLAEEESKRVKKLIDFMRAELGHCEHCARDILEEGSLSIKNK